MTPIEIIDHQTEQLKKVLISHGAQSDHFVVAFFQLQAAKMGHSEPYKWALSEAERQHKITLEQLPSMFEKSE
jgi:hypothetical protein